MQDPASAGEGQGAPSRGSLTLRNTAIVLAARVVSRLIALVTVIATLNHLGPARFGAFQDVANCTALAAVLVDLGLNTLYVRESARRPREIDRYLQNLLSSKALFSIAALVALALLLRIPNLENLLLPGFLLMVLTSYSNLLRGTLYARQRLGFEAVGIVLESVVLLSLVAAGVAQNRGVAYFIWAYAISYGFSCAYFAVVLQSTGLARLGLRLEPALIRSWAWQSLPFALSFVITTLYFKVDVPILYQLRGPTETGWYSSAYKPFEALLFVPITMANVVFPVLARLHQEDPGRVLRATERLCRGLVLLGWPLTVGTFLLAPGLVGILRLYPEAEPALRILAIGIGVMFLNNAFIAALNSIDRQIDFTVTSLVSLAVNVGLNLLLIPTYGYRGAAWATVATEIAFGIAGWALLRSRLGAVPLVRPNWRIVGSGLVMGAALIPLRNLHGLVLLPVVLGAAALYLVALFATRAVRWEEVVLARAALGGRPGVAR